MCGSGFSWRPPTRQVTRRQSRGIVTFTELAAVPFDVMILESALTSEPDSSAFQVIDPSTDHRSLMSRTFCRVQNSGHPSQLSDTIFRFASNLIVICHLCIEGFHLFGLFVRSISLLQKMGILGFMSSFVEGTKGVGTEQLNVTMIVDSGRDRHLSQAAKGAIYEISKAFAKFVRKIHSSLSLIHI